MTFSCTVTSPLTLPDAQGREDDRPLTSASRQTNGLANDVRLERIGERSRLRGIIEQPTASAEGDDHISDCWSSSGQRRTVIHDCDSEFLDEDKCAGRNLCRGWTGNKDHRMETRSQALVKARDEVRSQRERLHQPNAAKFDVRGGRGRIQLDEPVA